MEHIAIQNKLKILLEKVIEPGYVMNNYYADGLINKLSSCTDSELELIVGPHPVSDLIINTFNLTFNSHITVKVFITRLLAISSRKEINLFKMVCTSKSKLVEGLNDINSPNMNPSLRVAYLEVALSLIHPNTGLCCLISYGVWEKILSLRNGQHTVFIIRQTYKFATKFLWKLNNVDDEANVKAVLTCILQPLSEIDFVTMDSLTSDEEDVICKTIKPMLEILLAVVTDENRSLSSSLVLNMLIKDFTITKHLCFMMDRLRRDDVVLLSARLNFWFTIEKTLITKPNPDFTYSRDDFMEVTATYVNVILGYIQRRNATAVLDFCSSCIDAWKIISGDGKRRIIMNQTDKKDYNGRELITICLVPCIVYVKRIEKKTVNTLESVDKLINKMLDLSSEHIARLCYAMRDLCFDVTTDVTLQCIKRLTCMKNFLNDEQANLMFQALFCLLQSYDPVDAQGHIVVEDYYEHGEENVLIMMHVMETVLSLVKNHNINWQESLEIICLYTVVHNILKRPNLSCKFITTALNVIAVTVKKFLPPNLSLLMESKPGTSMHEIGQLIFMKLHDMNWEIRDSALELLLVCTEISYIKFPPFQKQILENKLINVAATIAFNDFEYYVQASALKCLGAASKLGNIWDQLKSEYPDILARLISILRNNQEGIVRKEACNVLCDIYQNLKLTPEFRTTLNEHMVSSALCDFHWEVQLTALKYWKIVIQSLLNDQGMLDGTFPPVTFSRTSRKIVTLNEFEIQKRLLQVLDDLASMGCLTVLVKLLHEDMDVEIMETALSISQDFLNILSQYKVLELVKPGEEEINVDEIACEEIKKEKDKEVDEETAEASGKEKSDNVIEGILNCDDINLLSSICERHLSLQNKSEAVMPKMQIVKSASPYVFLNYLKSNDLKAVVDHKRMWHDGIASVSSLLDDVLGIYDVNEGVNDEVNDLDCY